MKTVNGITINQKVCIHGAPARFSSPYGKINSYLFLTESGSDNIWRLDWLQKKDINKFNKDSNINFFSASGRRKMVKYIVGGKGEEILNYIMYSKDRGTGTELFGEPKSIKVYMILHLCDGNCYIFLSVWFLELQRCKLTSYKLHLWCGKNADMAVLHLVYGSAFTQRWFSWWTWLVYGSRLKDQTGLIIVILKKWGWKMVAIPCNRDRTRVGFAPLGVLPAMSFTPDR